MVKASRRGPVVEHLASRYLVSERHACRILCVARATFRYRSHCDPRTELRMLIREIAQARVRYGYRKIRVLLNREGWDVWEIPCVPALQGRRAYYCGRRSHMASENLCDIGPNASLPRLLIRRGVSTSLQISCRMGGGLFRCS
jgi:hypothetical protein